MNKEEIARRELQLHKWKSILDTVNSHIEKDVSSSPATDISCYLNELSALNGNVSRIIGGVEFFYHDDKKSSSIMSIRKYAEATAKGLHYRLNILQSVLKVEYEEQKNSGK